MSISQKDKTINYVLVVLKPIKKTIFVFIPEKFVRVSGESISINLTVGMSHIYVNIQHPSKLKQMFSFLTNKSIDLRPKSV